MKHNTFIKLLTSGFIFLIALVVVAEPVRANTIVQYVQLVRLIRVTSGVALLAPGLTDDDIHAIAQEELDKIKEVWQEYLDEQDLSFVPFVGQPGLATTYPVSTV